MAKSSAEGIEKSWPATNAEIWPVERIKPYEKNPRTHTDEQIAIIALSMREDGVTAPILVDEDGVIIYGHGRRLGAIANGYERYPVVIARGWSEKKKRAVRIKDNSIALMAGWNKLLVAEEMVTLRDAGYDLMTLGFPEIQIRSFGVEIGTPADQDPEAAPEVPKRPVSRLGDVWLMGDHRLICGDATSESDVALCLAGSEPKLMVTDPPYGVNYDPSWRERAKVSLNKKKMGRVANDDRADWRDAWKLFTGDVVYCWHAGLHAGSVAESLIACGFLIVGQIMWKKDRWALGRGDYHWQHEPAWYAVREGKKHNWCGARDQSTVWEIPSREDAGHGHGTQKPVECMKRPIENNSRIGDTVYEPFSGSGTTIIACAITQRRCRAIELEPAYVDVAVHRYANFVGTWDKVRLLLPDGTSLQFEEVQKMRARKAAGRVQKNCSSTDATVHS